MNVLESIFGRKPSPIGRDETDSGPDAYRGIVN